MTRSERQLQFVPLFLFSLCVDVLAAVAVATKDPVWSHLAMLWNGPLDDIIYLVAALQALLFLLDPSGEVTQGEGNSHSMKRLLAAFSEGKGLERMFSSQFLSGAKTTLVMLPTLLVAVLSVSAFWNSPVSIGLTAVVYRHLAMVFPIFLIVGAGISFLRMAPEVFGFWKATLFGWLGIALMTAVDGRWANHLFHLLANLESIQAWAVAILWAAFFAAKPALNRAEIGTSKTVTA